MNDLRIAYLITFYKDVSHLARLITQLIGRSTDIYIHIDKKIDINLKPIEGHFDGGNIYVLDDSLLVSWGGYNLTGSFIRLMKACRLNGPYDYVFQLSGQDFPLVSQSHIRDYLSKNKGSEFMSHWPMPFNGWKDNGGLDRYQFFWPVDEMGLHNATLFAAVQKQEGIQRSFYGSLEPFGGSCWFTITYELMIYICDFIDQQGEQITNYFRNVLLADEIMIHTIVMNSSFQSKVVNNNLRYIDWESGPKYPKILTVADFHQIKDSGCLFARKFDPTIDKEIIDMLEENL